MQRPTIACWPDITLGKKGGSDWEIMCVTRQAPSWAAQHFTTVYAHLISAFEALGTPAQAW